jgi:hypothetical protein
MYKLYDVVEAIRDFPKVPKGSKGTIVIVSETEEDFLVEFNDKESGKLLDLLEVNKNDLKKCNSLQ